MIRITAVTNQVPVNDFEVKGPYGYDKSELVVTFSDSGQMRFGLAIDLYNAEQLAKKLQAKVDEAHVEIDRILDTEGPKGLLPK
jgi:hypothetical protein